ncbi:SpoIID/LytB domain-containing protein [Prochlorococcus marinus]|uniref:Possible sporulation protein SpoIID n=1 Tax=Prochlorococcus marinus (strain MIT 9211) TaxID=93059 RepID=A9BBX1_PROM4|nr:SpoIID/LytB domain-containing protein [Prochlorococcus marinus]ABX09333.1 possible sporulation protein SpoIID [Prochlorococcus marinus str. MIT 9211]
MLKALFQLLPVFAIVLVYPITDIKAQQEPFIRVLLLDASNLSIRSDGSTPILVKGLDAISREKSLDSLKLIVENGFIKSIVNGDFKNVDRLPLKSALRIRSRDPRGIWLGKRRYAGELRVTGIGDKLRVINHLRVEKYLQSVVGGEMPKSWPMEALKAQAVAARTYALNQLKKKGNYDIGSTEQSQVYLGIESETANIRKAVKSTRPLVLVHNGKLIDAVFHSSSGGKTEDSGSVWKRQKPYLVSVIDFDQHAPSFKWTKTIPKRELQSIFSEIGGLNALRLTRSTKSDRVLEALAYGPKGKAVFSGKELRKRLGLKSTLIQFEMIIPKRNNNNKQEMINEYMQSTKSSKTTTIKSPFGLPPLPKIGIQTPPNLPVIPRDYALLVKGFGAGHGVGMSQWGANGMAKKGKNFKKILRHYYKGVRIIPFLYRYN